MDEPVLTTLYRACWIWFFTPVSSGVAEHRPGRFGGGIEAAERGERAGERVVGRHERLDVVLDGSRIGEYR